MSRDYGELEREFIDELEERTGKDLAAWMAAIDGAGLRDKNEIIDWLRPQGFTFAHASWLERIHHNGGQPVYGPILQPVRQSDEAPETNAPDDPDNTERNPIPPGGAEILAFPNPKSSAPQADTSSPPAIAKTAATQQPTQPSVDAGDIQSLVDQGKAYRPLARMLIDKIADHLPGLELQAQKGLVVFLGPQPAAALHISGKGLKLGLALSDDVAIPGDLACSPGRIPGGPETITMVVTLTDARQVNETLISLVDDANHALNS